MPSREDKIESEEYAWEGKGFDVAFSPLNERSSRSEANFEEKVLAVDSDGRGIRKD